MFRGFLVLVTMLLLALPVVGAEAPTYLVAGALFQNGGPTVPAVQVGGNLNVMSKYDSTSGDLVSQVMFRGVGFFSDDMYEVTGAIEAIGGFVVGKLYFGAFAVGTGIGIEMEFEEGENPVRPPVLLEGSWCPTNMLRVHAGAQYIPIGDNVGDLVFTYAGVGFSW